MFEKEAEEYRKDLKSKFFLSEPQLDLACQGYKDGAEFGYNKANEWHYVKDGDLPKETKVYLVYCADEEWCCSPFFKKIKAFIRKDVIAWCELPQVPKEK